jgi:hypothetical protein
MRFSLTPDTVFRRTSTGGVLLSKRNGEYRQLNATAASALTQLLDGETLDSVVARFTTEFPAVAESDLRDDVKKLVRSLNAQGVLKSE